MWMLAIERMVKNLLKDSVLLQLKSYSDLQLGKIIAEISENSSAAASLIGQETQATIRLKTNVCVNRTCHAR